MKEELYQKEIKDLTQDELYEILIDCGISSVKKVEPGQGGISFLEDLQSKEEKIEMENQTALIYYGILDKLEILKDSKVEYKLSCSIQYGNYKLSNNYKVA